MLRTREEVRKEIEAVEEGRKETWDTYMELMEFASQMFARYSLESQRLAELYAEEYNALREERGD